MLVERLAQSDADAIKLKKIFSPNTTITNSNASAPTAAPVGGTGTTAGAWDTATSRDAAIATINGLRTLSLELQTKLNALQDELRNRQIIK